MIKLKLFLLSMLGLRCRSQAINHEEHRVHSCWRITGHSGEHSDGWGHW